jgi:hypothetical protein
MGAWLCRGTQETGFSYCLNGDHKARFWSFARQAGLIRYAQL